MKAYQNFINGWFVPSNGDTLDVTNPATEEIISRVPETPVEQVREAIDAAEQAQRSWGKLPPVQRAGHLRRIASKIRERASRTFADLAGRNRFP